MDENHGTHWRAIAWALCKPALVAAIVALLVALGVTGLRTPGSMGAGGAGEHSGGGEDVAVASNTHFSGPLIVSGGIQAGNNLTLTGGSLLNSQGALTVTDDLVVSGVTSNSGGDWRVNDHALITGSLAVAGNVSDSSTMLRLNDNTLVTGTLGVSELATLGGGVSAGSHVTVTGAISASGGLAFAGLLRASPQVLQVTDYITPQAGLVWMTAQDWVSPTLRVDAAPDGAVVILCNVNDQKIYLADSGDVYLAGNMTLGEFDCLVLVNDAQARWYELARADN